MNLTTLSPEMDVEATLDRLCGDSALLLDILDMFLAEFIAEHPALQDGIHQAEWAALSGKAHYFKGIAENLGLIRFSSDIRHLERSAQAHDLAACTAAVESLLESTLRLQQLRDGIASH